MAPLHLIGSMFGVYFVDPNVWDIENYRYVMFRDDPLGIDQYTGNQDGQPLMTLEKKAAPEVSLSDLSGEWVIELVNGKKIVGTAEVTPFIGFNLDESRIYGNVGCNTINGALMQEDGKPNSLRFDNVATTMMMCPDMETETIVLNALNETKSFSMKDDKVYLLGENGNELLVLKKQ